MGQTVLIIVGSGPLYHHSPTAETTLIQPVCCQVKVHFVCICQASGSLHCDLYHRLCWVRLMHVPFERKCHEVLDQESLKLTFTFFFVLNKFIMLHMFVVVMNEAVVSVHRKATLLEETQLGDLFWHKLSEWLKSVICFSRMQIHQSNEKGADMTSKECA